MMRKIVILFIITALILLISPVKGNDSIKIAHPEFFPFFAKDKTGRTYGFFYQIIEEAINKRMKTKVIWTQMPWKRCQIQVKFGRYDGMITVPTKERMKYTNTHKDPFYMKELKLFTYRNHPDKKILKKIRNIDDIKRGNLSVITYSGNGWHKKNISSKGIISHDTSQIHNVWKMLAAERGDLVIEWPVGAYEGMKKAKVKNRIIELDVSMDAMPFHLLTNKKNVSKDFLEKFNDIIKNMKKNGTIDKIISSFLTRCSKK